MATAPLDYPYLHPVKKAVLKGVARVLDDSKRAVRRIAVTVRNEWSVLS